MASDKRWLIQIDYASEHGITTADYQFEEFEELSDIVERGPDWNAIKQIRVELNPRRRLYEITVEKAHEQ